MLTTDPKGAVAETAVVHAATKLAAIQLRLGPTANNHRYGINWAADYEFAAKLGVDRQGP